MVVESGVQGAAAPTVQNAKRQGLKLERYFTSAEDPQGNSWRTHWPSLDCVDWDYRTASILKDNGELVFEQKDVEVPKSWSQTALNVVASKYFRGQLGTPERESSVRQMIIRVVSAILDWGCDQGYYARDEDVYTHRDELAHLLVNQMISFNSPVWFNLGVKGVPQQVSACFISGVEDNLASIMEFATTEATVFKGGSGSGANLSRIRSSREHLSGGGMASGPVSFMRGYDSFAGAIKSGGRTRRAAKLVRLDADHPDVVEFVHCKVEEEKKAQALIDAGWPADFNNDAGAYATLQYQNANNSVGVTDHFMELATKLQATMVPEKDWHLVSRTQGKSKVLEAINARWLLEEIAKAAKASGCPGLQFHDTINRWNTTPSSGEIRASNPCGEYLNLDDTACNLLSLNLLKFRTPTDRFNWGAFQAAVRTSIIAMDILVTPADYPTAKIGAGARACRQLGLGYANLGALLMSCGLAYDSEAGRNLAAKITSLMTATAYQQSAELAKHLGAFPAFEVGKNREAMLGVLSLHAGNAKTQGMDNLPWAVARDLGAKHGFRNSQVTLLAPTGTIGFMMDCDTTGVEPDFSLVKTKKLVGGGTMKIVNQTVGMALQFLGYTTNEQRDILAHLEKYGHVEGAHHLKADHLAVFDCAATQPGATRSIAWKGHVDMVAAVQPFLSMGVSKTINMPVESTWEDVLAAYVHAWKTGCKSITVYVDGSKKSQPLSTKASDKAITPTQTPATAPVLVPQRRRLPDTRESVTHKFSIAGHEGYFTVGLYEDKTPGELFVRMAKEGSTISGLMDSWATMISLGLQSHVPLSTIVDKLTHVSFEPSGYTQNPDIPVAKSLVDYIGRWLGHRYLGHPTHQQLTQEASAEPKLEIMITSTSSAGAPPRPASDAPPCSTCGAIMQRAGACYACPSCGATTGCS